MKYKKYQYTHDMNEPHMQLRQRNQQENRRKHRFVKHNMTHKGRSSDMYRRQNTGIGSKKKDDDDQSDPDYRSAREEPKPNLTRSK